MRTVRGAFPRGRRRGSCQHSPRFTVGVETQAAAGLGPRTKLQRPGPAGARLLYLRAQEREEKPSPLPTCCDQGGLRDCPLPGGRGSPPAYRVGGTAGGRCRNTSLLAAGAACGTPHAVPSVRSRTWSHRDTVVRMDLQLPRHPGSIGFFLSAGSFLFHVFLAESSTEACVPARSGSSRDASSRVSARWPWAHHQRC